MEVCQISDVGDRSDVIGNDLKMSVKIETRLEKDILVEYVV